MTMVYILMTDNVDLMQDYQNGIHSVWTSKAKALKECKILNDDFCDGDEIWTVEPHFIQKK